VRMSTHFRHVQLVIKRRHDDTVTAQKRGPPVRKALLAERADFHGGSPLQRVAWRRNATMEDSSGIRALHTVADTV
jgi:hypothetical protein